MPAIQGAAVGADPERAIRSGEEGGGRLVIACWEMNGFEAIPNQERQAAFGAHPHRAVPIFQHRSNAIIAKSGGLGENRRMSVIDGEEPIFRSHPHPVAGSRRHGAHIGMGELAHASDRFETTVREHGNPCPGADPEATGAVAVQAGDVLVGQRRLVVAVEDGEAYPVESGEPFLGADPQIAIRGSCDCLGGGLRKTFRNLPVVEAVLGQLQGWVECMSRNAACEQPAEE